MESILKLILGAVLRFLWDRAEQWYQTELRYQRTKRILIEEAKNAARKVADDDAKIAADVESVDDSFLRLEELARRSEAYQGGVSGVDTSGEGESSAIPLSDLRSLGSPTGVESPSGEFMDSIFDGLVSSTERGV